LLPLDLAFIGRRDYGLQSKRKASRMASPEGMPLRSRAQLGTKNLVPDILSLMGPFARNLEQFDVLYETYVYNARNDLAPDQLTSFETTLQQQRRELNQFLRFTYQAVK
jgi:hypothetical protein